jgi:hypothetical protein
LLCRSRVAPACSTLGHGCRPAGDRLTNLRHGLTVTLLCPSVCPCYLCPNCVAIKKLQPFAVSCLHDDSPSTSAVYYTHRNDVACDKMMRPLLEHFMVECTITAAWRPREARLQTDVWHLIWSQFVLQTWRRCGTLGLQPSCSCILSPVHMSHCLSTRAI